MAYARGDYVRSYQLFSEGIGERDLESLSTDEVYTMAVLSYLNGLVEDARRFLALADDEGRRRMASVLSLLPGSDAGI